MPFDILNAYLISQSKSQPPLKRTTKNDSVDLAVTEYHICNHFVNYYF